MEHTESDTGIGVKLILKSPVQEDVPGEGAGAGNHGIRIGIQSDQRRTVQTHTGISGDPGLGLPQGQQETGSNNDSI
jgi:hypothetical protein